MIYTMGHSNLTAEAFADLIRPLGVTKVIDVRSYPSSRYVPWVNSGVVGATLRKLGFEYLYAGNYLGGMAEYEVTDERFLLRLNKVVSLGAQCNLVLMCAEKDPSQCHRAYKLCSTIHRLHPDVVMTHIVGAKHIDTRQFEQGKPYSFVSDYHPSHLTDLTGL